MSSEGEGEDLQAQYRLAVEEYRFQVDLNWRRSEYFFVLNVGVLVAGATLLASGQVPRGLVALVFCLGALLALLSIFANHTQHGYYRGARDLKNRMEQALELGDRALVTTPGQGSSIERLGKVGTFLRTMLIAIACVNLVGAGIAVADATSGEAALKQVSIRVPPSPAGRATKVTVVISRGGEVMATRSGMAGGVLRSVGLEPDRYRIWMAAGKICTTPLVVSAKPLQLASPHC